MPAPQWPASTGVIALLSEAPYRFGFFQTVRLLERWLCRQGACADSALHDGLRFHQSVALAFPACEIEAVWHDGEHGRLHLRPSFMGLLGVNGTLPLHYTERLIRQERAMGDAGARAFLDALSQRAPVLFYQAWAGSRIECQADASGRPGFLSLQLALAGAWPSRLASAGALPPEALAYYAAALRHRPVSAELMADVLGDYFGVPLRIESFVSTWHVRPGDEHSLLNLGNVSLGQGAMLGARCRRRDLRVRLYLGPLTRAQFDDFLPGNSGALALKSMLSLFGMPSMQYEIRLILRTADVHGSSLTDRMGQGAACLGQAARLLAGEASSDCDAMHYDLRFPGAA
ncbi:type VI secretion system baseplate subunit TssG [Janthinobacterium sp. FW305-129]|uniref:type VI secretion system baseplate subunit TssG n=1 Tax=Janthinobacterium sp. FW305-129 TaxID=2775054 RepID=UPI001E570F19|nr:type VI secretion system baseplate subunit TssG [Janthinobacterium sp. FW305-129]MCC7599248.1 type VI secretion system baseplate subunit TssG [Janthinobacterium sp. FW305-129]